MRFGTAAMMSLDRMEAEEEGGDDSEGEGTGSTELSDIRLLGRCEEESDRQADSLTKRPHHSAVTASLCLKGLNAPLEPPGKNKGNSRDFWHIFVRYKKYYFVKLNECLTRTVISGSTHCVVKDF